MTVVAQIYMDNLCLERHIIHAMGKIGILKSSNGWHYGVIFFKPEKNLEFFRLKNDPIDAYPGKLE